MTLDDVWRAYPNAKWDQVYSLEGRNIDRVSKDGQEFVYFESSMGENRTRFVRQLPVHEVAILKFSGEIT